jgi:hypothetical protein
MTQNRYPHALRNEFGIRSDNRPENLELWARGMQLPGSRVSDLIDAAVRVLRAYRPELLSASVLDPNEIETKSRRLQTRPLFDLP